MSISHSNFNRALSSIPKRAEQQQAHKLRETFLDSGIAVALDTIDNQVLYGRRGTGKTHALRYLESNIKSKGHIPVYADLRTVGSPDSMFAPDSFTAVDRASRLLVDLIQVFHDQLLQAALEDDDLPFSAEFNEAADAITRSISTIRVEGDVEYSTSAGGSQKTSDQASVSVSGSRSPGFNLGHSSAEETSNNTSSSESVRGTARISLRFSEIAKALRKLSLALSERRIWILLDEWSSIPADTQPLLGEFLVRRVTPNPNYTVKIASIEQQSNFRDISGRQAVGIELGADFFANANLDELMVYEQDAGKSIDFFKGLFFKHLTSHREDDEGGLDISSAADVIRTGFTDRRAFHELVRAAEGVPRDAINIAAQAGYKAGAKKISVNDVRNSAQTWYQSDKARALVGNQDATSLMNWVVDRVIKDKKARGFLINQDDSANRDLLALFDARVLHLVRRGYSAQHRPGERFDVWLIDYGAYVDLMRTRYEPDELIPGLDVLNTGSEPSEDGFDIEVPDQDLRAIRQAILDFDEFYSSRR